MNVMGTAITRHSRFIFRLARLLSLVGSMRVYLTVKQFLLLLQCNRCWKNSWDSTVSITAWVPVRMLSWMRRPFTYFSSVPSFFLFSSMRDRMRMAVFYSFIFYWPAKKRRSRESTCASFCWTGTEVVLFMLVLISLDNNALTVQFLVDRQGTITFGFF